MPENDLVYQKALKQFGFRIEYSGNTLQIKRRMRLPLFLWAYLIVFGFFQIVSSFELFGILLWLIIFVIILLLYFRNRASLVIIDPNSETIVFKKGLLRLNHYKNYHDVVALELHSYDVPTSASPFEKGNREYIAEIRLALTNGLPVDLLNFEDRSIEKVKIAEIVHKEIVEFSGLKSAITSG